MTDHIKAARSIWGESAILPFGELERFWAMARNQALEDAANIVQANAQLCATGGYGYALLSSNAAAIRALKDKP